MQAIWNLEEEKNRKRVRMECVPNSGTRLPQTSVKHFGV